MSCISNSLIRISLFGYFIVGVFLLTGCHRPVVQLIQASPDKANQFTNEWVTLRQPRFGQVLLVDSAGHHYPVSVASVWGYQTKRGAIYRLYQDLDYEVLQQGPLIIYRATPWTGDVSLETYYFSLTADGRIWHLDKRTCRQVFENNPCMLELLKHMRDTQLTQTDGHGAYALVNAYTYCQSAK